MCPAAGLQPLRVAPEDVEMAEAGNLVSKLGIFNQAKGLQQAVARQMPKALRVAMQRFEHVERSKRLDPDEVMARAQESIVEEGGTPGVVARILGARVRGDKNDPYDGAVIIQYETPEGRTGYCAVLYNSATFPKGIKAYDNAVRDGEVKRPGELSDAPSLRDALEESHRENARLQAEVEGSVPAEVGEPDLPEGVVAGDPGYPMDEQGNLLVLPGSVRDELIAAAEEVEAEGKELTVEDLPAGVSAGDPGYPIDPATGHLVQMPDDARLQLIEAHERQVEAEEEAAAAKVTKWPEDLSTIELPAGNAESLVAGLPYYSTVVVAALAQYAKAQSTKDAAAAELAKRPDKPETAS